MFSSIKYINNTTQGAMLMGGVSLNLLAIDLIQKQIGAKKVNTIKINTIGEFRKISKDIQLESVYEGKWFLLIDVKSISDKDLITLFNSINHPLAFFCFYTDDFKTYIKVVQKKEFKNLPNFVTVQTNRLDDSDFPKVIAKVLSEEKLLGLINNNKKTYDFMLKSYKYAPESLISFLFQLERGETPFEAFNLTIKQLTSTIGAGSTSVTYLLMMIFSVRMTEIKVSPTKKETVPTTLSEQLKNGGKKTKKITRALTAKEIEEEFNRKVNARIQKEKQRVLSIYYDLTFIMSAREIYLTLRGDLNKCLEVKQLQLIGELTRYNTSSLRDTKLKKLTNWFKFIERSVSTHDVLMLRKEVLKRSDYMFKEDIWLPILIGDFIETKLRKGLGNDKGFGNKRSSNKTG